MSVYYHLCYESSLQVMQPQIHFLLLPAGRARCSLAADDVRQSVQAHPDVTCIPGRSRMTDLVVGAPFHFTDEGGETGGAIYIYSTPRSGLTRTTEPTRIFGRAGLARAGGAEGAGPWERCRSVG